jgi:hypothetical protein
VTTAATPASTTEDAAKPALNAAKGRKNSGASNASTDDDPDFRPENWPDRDLKTLSEAAQAELEEAQDAWDTLTYLNDHRMLDYDTIADFYYNFPEAATHALMSLIRANPFAARQHAIDIPESIPTTG